MGLAGMRGRAGQRLGGWSPGKQMRGWEHGVAGLADGEGVASWAQVRGGRAVGRLRLGISELRAVYTREWVVEDMQADGYVRASWGAGDQVWACDCAPAGLRVSDGLEGIGWSIGGLRAVSR